MNCHYNYGTLKLRRTSGFICSAGVNVGTQRVLGKCSTTNLLPSPAPVALYSLQNDFQNIEKSHQFPHLKMVI